MDIGNLLRVLIENCPNEAAATFLATWGVFIITIILIVIVLVRFIKKTSVDKDSSEKELKVLKASVEAITIQASKIAVDNANVTDSIKNEIKANNDVTMQLLISFGLAAGMQYTDIQNIIEKSKTVYNASVEAYDALNKEVEEKMAEDEAKALEQQAVKEAEIKESVDKLSSFNI